MRKGGAWWWCSFKIKLIDIRPIIVTHYEPLSLSHLLTPLCIQRILTGIL